MKMMANEKRAIMAEKGVEAAYAGTEYAHEDLKVTIGYLLGDIKHLCDREGLDFDARLDKGTNHYHNELAMHPKLSPAPNLLSTIKSLTAEFQAAIEKVIEANNK